MADVDDAGEKPKRSRPPGWGLAAAVAGAMAVVVALVVTSTGAPTETDRDPLELSNDQELRAVVAAVSGVVSAEDEAGEDAALRALEALRPSSPGAADLRESCVTTYRGTHDAQRMTEQARGMIPGDGGEVRGEDRARLSELLDRSQRLVVAARESHQRCVGLYEAAAQRLHVTPARRRR